MGETIVIRPAIDEKAYDAELHTFEKDRTDVLAQTSSRDADEQLVIGVLDRRTEYGWVITSWMAMILCGMFIGQPWSFAVAD